MASDPANNDNFYIFNPESVLKVSMTTIEDKVEALYVRKRYEESLFLINNTYGKPMLEKVQSGYFSHLLAIGQTEKA